MRRKNYNVLFMVIGILVFGIVCLSIAYAVLSSTLETKFGEITQESLTFDVGFKYYSNMVTEPLHPMLSNNLVECNSISPKSKTTITGIKVKFNEPGNYCKYYIPIYNKGNIDAQITSITPKMPSGVSCSILNGGATMVCGDITYKLGYTKNTNQPQIGDVIKKKSGSTDTEETITLTIEYTGNSAYQSSFSQAGFGFSIVYGQK